LQECYKIFIGGKALLILLAFGAFVWFSYTPINEKFASADEIYYKQYMLKLEGELTPEKEQFLIDEQAKFEQAQTDMQNELANGNMFAAMKYQNILAPQTAFELVKSHAEYLKKSGGEFVYDTGYKLLTGDKSAGNKDAILALTALAMLICTLTYVYSIEYETGAAVLLHTSPRGRGAVFARKFVIGLIIVTVIYALTYAPYFYNVLHAYGTRLLSASAGSMEHLSGADMSILAYLMMLSVIRFLGLILSMLLIFFISAKAKSFISSLLIETAVLIVPIVLYLLEIVLFTGVGHVLAII
jgi:ABC-type transport system involved in multi-copper enzyme maturation permease subunit